jgi:hypothetical protein
MCRRNVYEYSEHFNHKDRGIKYPEYREVVGNGRGWFRSVWG